MASSQPVVGAGPSTPVGSPVPPALYPLLATVLLVGASVAAARFARTLHGEKRGSSIAADVTLGVLASSMAGVGTLFLLAWTGLYV
jgi:hypothetical protein